jgi:hypothetical protein
VNSLIPNRMLTVIVTAPIDAANNLRIIRFAG